MLRIEDNIISLDVLEKKFKCDPEHCKGNCCRYGDSGAPLTSAEVKILADIQSAVLPYLREAGKKAIAEMGPSVIDFEGENVTPLIGNEECAYAIIESDIFLCGIERAWYEGKINFRKPLSCHLFPVRMKQYRDFLAVNYQELTLCMTARKKRERGKYLCLSISERTFDKSSWRRGLRPDLHRCRRVQKESGSLKSQVLSPKPGKNHILIHS